jgi:general secretion pathway protein A
MYLEHWNMHFPPFQNVPNAAFFYPSPIHQEALERMVYAIVQGKGAAMITGEIGCGKTMVSQVLLKRLGKENLQVVAMTNPALSPGDFLEALMGLFHLSNDHSLSKAKAWQCLDSHFRWNLDQGKGSVLIVDEAQAINEEATLEEIRMLLNLQSDSRFLVSVILLGHSKLEELVSRNEALSQRIPIRYRLRPFSLAETFAYVKRRLEVAGCRSVPFTRESFKVMHSYSRGVPRDVNNLCDRSLLAAYLADRKRVTVPHVEEAWKDLYLAAGMVPAQEPSPPQHRRRLLLQTLGAG